MWILPGLPVSVRTKTTDTTALRSAVQVQEQDMTTVLSVPLRQTLRRHLMLHLFTKQAEDPAIQPR